MLPVALVFESTFEHNREGRQLNRFRQELFGAQFDGSHSQVNRPMTGQDDRGDGRIDALKLAQNIECGAIGQSIIENDGIGLVPAEFVNRVLAGCSLGYFEPTLLEKLAGCTAEFCLVIDNQHLVGH